MRKRLIAGWAAVGRGEVTLQAWWRRMPTKHRFIHLSTVGRAHPTKLHESTAVELQRQQSNFIPASTGNYKNLHHYLFSCWVKTL